MKTAFKRGLAALLTVAMLCGPAGVTPALAQDAPPPSATSAPAATAMPTPGESPTGTPTAVPTAEPTAVPTAAPTAAPTAEPTAVPVVNALAPAANKALTLQNATSAHGTGYDWDGANLTLGAAFNGYQQLLFDSNVTDATITLTGDVTIDPAGGSNITSAIMGNANLTIDPNGHRLTLGAGDIGSIYLRPGALTVTGSNGGTLDAGGALFAEGDITLSGNIDVSVHAAARSVRAAICSNMGSLTITGAADVLADYPTGDGIFAHDNIAIDTTGTVTATCKNDPYKSAITAGLGYINISNGKITASGAISAGSGDLIIGGDAVINATGLIFAVGAFANLTIGGNASVTAITTGVVQQMWAYDQPYALWSYPGGTGTITIKENATVKAWTAGVAGPGEVAGLAADMAPDLTGYPNPQIAAGVQPDPALAGPYDPLAIGTYRYLSIEPKPAPTVFTVQFDPNGGAVSPASGTLDANHKLTALPTPTYAGYTFAGWFTAKTGGTAVTLDTVYPESTTIFAQWTPVAQPTAQPTPSPSPAPAVTTPTAAPGDHSDIGPAIANGTWGKDDAKATPAPAAKTSIPQTGDGDPLLLWAVAALAALGGLVWTIKRKKGSR